MIFPNTNWTILAEATLSGGESERRALGELCERYRDPVAAVIRSRGAPAERVEDLTQDFFLALMEGSFFKRAQREQGKFRSFLMNALRNFLADDARRTTALKRGGTWQRVELHEDIATGDESVVSFDYAWAENLFDAAVEVVGEEVKGKRGVEGWSALRVFLTGVGDEGQLPGYVELGRDLGLSEGGAKAEVSRMRAKFRDCLRREVGRTVSAPHEIDEELAFLRETLMNHSRSK